MKEIVKKLIDEKKTISTMESCTGGHIVDSFTNVKGCSQVLLYSCVTYSNLFKIKMGVSSELINKYTVYSKEVAADMALKISEFTNSDFGIGVTGNLTNANDVVFISIYIKENKENISFTFSSSINDRKKNKDIICELISKKLLEIV